MWKWSCPAQPTLVWVHHSLEGAQESIALHVFIGSPFHGGIPCEMIHTPVDDGVPCDVEDCVIPYIPSTERR